MKTHIPYGYRIVDAKAIIDKDEAEQVRRLFEEYISGKALKVAAENVGLNIFHSSAGNILRNTRYLGDDYYPAIICREVFEKAEEERQSRARKLGRVWELKTKELPAAPMSFTMGRQTKAFNDPYEQAEYEYSLIESEINRNEHE